MTEKNYMKKGLFITLEGIDACGKSTQLKLISKWLTNQNIEHIITREPGGTKISEKIREILLDINNNEMTNNTEILLYLAARAQHVEQKIIPALNKNLIVLSDRFQESSCAYQCFGRGLDLSTFNFINSFATKGLVPDLTFIIDISLDVSRERLFKTGNKLDRLENENKSFFEKIKNGYLKLAHEYSQIKVINGENSISEITCEMKNNIMTKLLEIECFEKLNVKG
jgi:dTMP kinase